MIENILKIVLVTATVYNADPKQTDDTPYITASGAIIEQCCPGDHRWIAVSRDLEDEGFVFGAKVKITGTDHYDGIWTVQDRMNKRWTRRIDFLVNKEMKGGKWTNIKIKLIQNDTN